MNVLIVGSGGREHALAWKLKQSQQLDRLYCIPGNAGISEIAECVDIDVNALDILLNWSQAHYIDLVVVGPEAPLVSGIQDLFSGHGIPVFGPSKAAAQLEGSKIFTKLFCEKHNIPTAEFDVCRSTDEAERAIASRNGICVVKADGLAAGKGVYVCKDRSEAAAAVNEIMVNLKYGTAGSTIIIEDLLVGEEASIMAICDGADFVVLESSQDHKALEEGDEGPNTGGMGAYSPAPVVDEVVKNKVIKQILKPVVKGMKSDGNPFTGVLYAGVMVSDGQPYLLEINVRFGDPETQPVLMRLESDLLEIMCAAVEGCINTCSLEWSEKTAICVVAASGGYPESYKKGNVITGLSKSKDCRDVMIFHAGTKISEDKIETSGGRVLGVTALGTDISSARNRVYNVLQSITFDGIYYRKDIAWRAINR